MNTAFHTDIDSILERVNAIKPEVYGRTRNYVNGAVTYLSPYISRGVISTKFVLNSVLERGYDPKRIEKFIQELTWRDYWQRVWIARENEINNDIKNTQEGVFNNEMPTALVVAKTGITAIDSAIVDFYKTGYLHNHVRMYIASLACNFGKSHWLVPAKWMYYHLLDADWASNSLSWQWIAGTNSSKKYIANQQNINKYCFTEQRGTFLDKPYEELYAMGTPEVLQHTEIPELATELPEVAPITIDPQLPTLLYNYHNMDPFWRKDERVNRVLLIEPSYFQEYPVCERSMLFLRDLGRNINGLLTYVGNFEGFVREHQPNEVIFKEHPMNAHYKGKEDPREWMFGEYEYFPSFFGYWKKCQKELVA